VNGGSYTCQFDAQFCTLSLDVNGCFTHLNTVSASLAGDEPADQITVTGGSLNLKECLSGSVIALPNP